MDRFTFPGRTAVVTGAASGIGEALAHGLARRGTDLVLLDVDAARLDTVAGDVRRAHPGRTVSTHVVDLADRQATADAAQRLAAEHPRLDLLVNNAGVSLGGRLSQVTFDEYWWLIEINFRAVVQLTHALLPALTAAAPGSHLVTVSSLFGLVAPPGQTAYAASKFAVRGFTESLRGELAEVGIGATCVHPGGIRTRIAESARIGSGVDPAEVAAHQAVWRTLLTIQPAVAADVILRGVERRSPRVLIGASARGLDLLARLAPAWHGQLVAAGTRRLVGTAASARTREPAAGSPGGRLIRRARMPKV